MNIKEAGELAQAIEGNSLFAVIAVGRFVMTDELTAASKQSLQWGVSVVLLSDKSDRTVIFNEGQWRAYATAAGKNCQSSSQTKQVQPSKCSTHSAAREEEQLSLF